MLTEHSVAKAAADAGVEGPVRFVASTGSTNTDLLREAAEGAPAWTILVAGEQRGGRGRLGRIWVSTPGSSLLCSVLLRPALAADEASLLALAAGVAMAEACEEACGVGARCKWPNDVVVRGRKLGGVLTEGSVRGARLDHLVVGVGVNVGQRPSDFPPDLAEGATSVAIEGGTPDLAALLRAYLAALRALCGRDDSGVAGRVLPAYRERCDSLGRRVRAEVARGRTVEGTAVDVGPRGELLVDAGGGRERVTFGEIVHLR